MKKMIMILLLVPSLAFAHSGHDAGGLSSGLLHPLSGVDHLLAMISLGLLAMQFGGRARWIMPLTFVAAMLAGGAIAAAGLPMFAVEPLILASIIVFGVMIALAVRLPLTAALPLVVLFGAAHGWAHGAEGPAIGLTQYFTGFALATAALHAIGMFAGYQLSRVSLRGLGLATTAAGLLLVIAG